MGLIINFARSHVARVNEKVKLLDSYEKFLSEYVAKEDFFNFSLNETIYIPIEKVAEEFYFEQRAKRYWS